MDKKSKIFFLVFFLLIALAVGATYWRIMVKKDYIVTAQTDCDPYTEKCFIWECDPESKIEGEACTGDAEKDTWYYQIAERNAANVPLCDPNDETCDPWTCGDPPAGEAGGELECSTTFCDEATKIDQGVECSDPVKYAEENPVEEEAVECEEGDEECLSAQEQITENAETDNTADTSQETAPAE